ncbi:hypothetical protein M422DRAFT_274820 [Sphaerobolus stellatus SS14]|uniref:Uncharacterized protein n=1 Tax=Sphaerobolus stellatus (strain SS14) TaxID=990650 RepID=A0A0C9TRB0_SPHS4|nr:hypothetical protein M422DRAFT_274820 [Sphaerobolus stellatus SS14]
MSTCCTRKSAVGEAEPIQGLTLGELLIPPPPSVDSQQRPEVLAPEHPDELHAQDYGNQGELMIPSPNSVDTQQSPETVPSRIQLPLRAARPSCTAAQGLSPSQLAGMSATQGTYSPQGIGLGSGSWQNLSDVTSDPELVSLAAGDTEEDKDFIIPASEYTEFINLKENAEIVVSEAMEATEQVNTVFTQIRASMNRMSPRMQEILLVPSKKVSGKMCEPANNWAHDKAAAKAATECSIDQMAMMMSAPGSGTDERVRTTRSGIPGDWYPQSQPNQNIP